ncbi:21907_t:CDS:2 [Cetraspora pellucida]|uniref:21907_t:CDS:1 n=1 Tax=Cetraspora pellucida TaxID=1433469 RepID=A0A9N9I7P4_9GLOM|nr:21907_t:CDS:2 [Cetraspora pellucida]
MSSVQERNPWPYALGMYLKLNIFIKYFTLQVQGKIPEWLEGVLYRVGPGTFKIPSKKNPEIVFSFDHWFDGLGQVHRFEIRNGVVTYRSRNIASANENYIAENGRLPVTDITFGQDICKNVFKKFFTVFQASVTPRNLANDPNQRNVSVTLTKGLPYPEGKSETKVTRTLVLGTDANILKSIDPVTLEPIQNFSFEEFHPDLSGPMAPAHSQYDAETGEYFSFVPNSGSRSEYNVFSVKTDEETGKPVTTILATIPSKLTQCDFVMNGAKILWERNLIRSFDPWDPNKKAHFYVIDRNLKKHVATYTSPTFFCFHTINAYDEGDDIIIDLSQFKDNSVIFQLTINRLLESSEIDAEKQPQKFELNRLYRYKLGNVSKNLDRVNLNYGNEKFPNAEIVFAVSEDLNVELPVVNFSRYHMKKYRYVYGVSRSDSNSHFLFDRLIKIDLHQTDNGSFNHKIWRQFGCTPSEPIFVSAPNAVEEDDGVITSIVLDGTKNSSFLLILDAKSFKEIARAEMELGKVVPYGFHGLWNDLD